MTQSRGVGLAGTRLRGQAPRQHRGDAWRQLRTVDPQRRDQVAECLQALAHKPAGQEPDQPVVGEERQVEHVGRRSQGGGIEAADFGGGVARAELYLGGTLTHRRQGQVKVGDAQAALARRLFQIGRVEGQPLADGFAQHL